jgi:alkylation response protein AidB-like acyl-CoA dehydrogenase
MTTTHADTATATGTSPEPVDALPTVSAPEVELLAPDSARAVLANTRALLPLVAAEADDVERLARLTPRLERAFRAAGVFEMAFPAFRGGLEMTVAQQVEVVAEVAAVDASAGWNIGVLNAGGFYAARLGDAAYAELYPTRDMPTSGSFHPRGRAQRVEGGYLVTGYWDWGSGSYTAEHVVSGVEVFDGDEPVPGTGGKQMHLGVWVPKDQITFLHNWQTLGVRGSGSTSYEITEPVFVPADHAFDREAEYDQERDPLNRSVKIAHYALTGVSLGVARHLAEMTSDLLAQRIGPRGAAGLDSASLQALGQAMGEVDFAYAGVRAVADMVDDVVFGGAVLTPLHEARMTAANALSAAALRRVLEVTTEMTGGRLVLDTSPIQRVVRDAYGALAHAGARRAHLGSLAATALEHRHLPLTLPADAHGGGAFSSRLA